MIYFKCSWSPVDQTYSLFIKKKRRSKERNPHSRLVTLIYNSVRKSYKSLQAPLACVRVNVFFPLNGLKLPEKRRDNNGTFTGAIWQNLRDIPRASAASLTSVPRAEWKQYAPAASSLSCYWGNNVTIGVPILASHPSAQSTDAAASEGNIRTQECVRLHPCSRERKERGCRCDK